MKSLMTPKSFRIIKMLSLDYSENCAICKFKNVFLKDPQSVRVAVRRSLSRPDIFSEYEYNF